jgi:two-component sensor histidine kinase
LNTITFAGQRGKYSLRSLLFLALAIATWPLAILGIWLEVLNFQASSTTADSAFHDSVDGAATEASATLNRVQSLLSTLALDAQVRAGGPGCKSRLQDIQQNTPAISSIVRYDATTAALCDTSENGPASGIQTQEWWTKARQNAQFQVTRPVSQAKAADTTLLAILALTKADGTFDGTLTADLTNASLPRLLRSSMVQEGEAVFAMWDQHQNIIHSSDETLSTKLFWFPSASAKAQSPTRTVALDGTSWIVSRADVPVQGIHLSVALKQDVLFREGRWRMLSHTAIIAMLLLLTNALFMLAGNNRISRWIGLLHTAASTPLPQHASTLAVGMQGAPKEFRELGSALLSINHQMNLRNADLEQAATVQKELAREVHHRVANTLQIVMSLMNLQAHRTKSLDARHAIEQARARVNTLALANRIVDSYHARSDIDLQRVIEETIAQSIRQAGTMSGTFQVDTQICPCNGNAATAIPLALFVNEALSDAMEHGMAGSDSHRQITVSLEHMEEDEMILSILCGGETTGVKEEPVEENMRPLLMKALAMQLSGRLQPVGQDRSACCISLAFPVTSPA